MPKRRTRWSRQRRIIWDNVRDTAVDSPYTRSIAGLYDASVRLERPSRRGFNQGIPQRIQESLEGTSLVRNSRPSAGIGPKSFARARTSGSKRTCAQSKRLIGEFRAVQIPLPPAEPAAEPTPRVRGTISNSLEPTGLATSGSFGARYKDESLRSLRRLLEVPVTVLPEDSGGDNRASATNPPFVYTITHGVFAQAPALWMASTTPAMTIGCPG